MTVPARAEEILARLEHEGIKLGHERMLSLLSALGDPHLRLPAVLVAGTNGKGSVSSLLDRISREAGYRVGLYTSPHLESPVERIRVDGHDILDGKLAEWLELLLATSERIGLERATYFEALTLAAFLHFEEAKVDLAVLEVGLGGRLDATNVVSPLLSVITAIGFDHEKVLGDTLGAIAGEKVRVARPGRSLVAWTELPEVAETVSAYCRAIGAELFSAEKMVAVEPLGPDQDGQRVRVQSPRYLLEATARLLGRHQHVNLGIAVLAAEKLADAGFPRVDGAAIACGIGACAWPGRLEWMRDPAGHEVLIDAAHNPDGAAALAAYLDELGRPFDLLFGALGDKAVEKMLPRLATGATRVILTRPPSPRAVDPRGWQTLLHDRRQLVAVGDVPAAALGHALEHLEGRPLVICGSIYLIGDLRRILREDYGFVSSISG